MAKLQDVAAWSVKQVSMSQAVCSQRELHHAFIRAAETIDKDVARKEVEPNTRSNGQLSGTRMRPSSTRGGSMDGAKNLRASVDKKSKIELRAKALKRVVKQVSNNLTSAAHFCAL